MRRWNKILILMLAMVVMTGILVGCGTGEATFEGVGSKKLTKT